MKIDITGLLMFFDELMPSTDEEQGYYWLKTKRSDGVTIILVFSIYECYVSVIIENASDVGFSRVRMTKCTEVNILDADRKCLEVIHRDGVGRCFLSLLGDSILDYTN